MARRLDQILVVDVESTCWKEKPPEGSVSEIIQIGICPVDVTKLTRLEKQSLLVKPQKSEISDYCRELTQLEPHMFEGAGTMADATRILKKEHFSKDRLWASWGDYDRRQFERTCREQGVGYPFGISHLNVKTLYATARGCEHELGMDEALVELGFELEGTHHRGDDDAWNIAGVLCHLLKCIRGAS